MYLERFSDLLSNVARYVRSLNYSLLAPPISDHELNILDMLKERSSLQSIELDLPGTFSLKGSGFDASDTSFGEGSVCLEEGEEVGGET